MAVEPDTTAPAGVTALQGVALYVGAVLGTGVIALPALAAEAAGPASLIAWLVLCVVSAPMAGTFAALGARYPDAGGVSTYVRLAFGDRAAAVVGWCFYFAVPFGAPAAATFGGAYVSAAVGGGRLTTAVAAIAMMLLVAGANAFGVHLTGRLQLVLAGVLVVFLAGAVVVALPHADPGNLQPFAPHGFGGVVAAMALLTWSFVGWEAITHLAAEFRNPRRDLPRATIGAVAVVGVLYLALAFAVIVVLGPAAAHSAAPLGDLLAIGIGGNARVLAAVVAVLLTLGTMNAYVAATAKLGAALGRDGSLPGWLAKGSSAGEVPRRSLAVVSGAAVAAGLVAFWLDIGPAPLVLLTTGSFVTVYAVGVAAAVKLLPRGGRSHRIAVVALVAVAGLAVATGAYLLWAVVVAAAALGYLRWRRSRPGGA